MNSIDWHSWQIFCVIAKCGSLNKASEQLGLSQPTLSRKLAAMENTLGQSLFDRSTRGLQATEFALSLMEESDVMQRSAERLERIAQGLSQSLRGRIRLSVNELVALYYLPEILTEFMQTYDELFVEIEVSNLASSLDKRDADVAIRMFPPKQLDIVARKLFDIELGFFAAPDYLSRAGIPSTAKELLQHRILGYDRDLQFESGAQDLGWRVRNEDFNFRCDFMPMHIEMAKQGAGIVATHHSLALLHGLESITLDIALPALPVYLACHRDVQQNKKIRVLMDFLANKLPHAPGNKTTTALSC